MGVWFLASAYANFVAGRIAAVTGAETEGGEVVDAAAAAANYIEVYTQVGLLAVGVGGVLLLVSPWLKRGMHGVR